MDTSLVIVTLLSLAMAASLSVVVWRLLREERRRSDARVMALTGLAARSEPIARVAPRRAEPARVADPLDLPLNPSAPLRPAPPASRLAPPVPNLAPRASRPAPPVSPMFAERQASSPWGHRLLVMAALALAGASVILFALTAETRSATERRVPPRGTASAANVPAPALELLSLRDERDGDALTISGTVRNPRGASAMKRITVTAIAFDTRGAYISTGRALLDVTALAPGDESPFVVTLPSAQNVARYRIAFRGEDGAVIAHTDRRQSTPVADATTAAAIATRSLP